MKKKTIVLIWIGALMLVLLAIIVWLLDIPHWQSLNITKIYETPNATRVFDMNGIDVGNVYASENRIYTPLNELPDYAVNAFVAAEDARFYSHGGVDIVRIFGAIWHDIKTMSLSQGASTITQQLIKMTHLSSEKTFSRKAQEAYLAICLENKLTKVEILEAYINCAYFGRGAYGIGTASEAYFGKPASTLRLGEAAMLAGIIKSPGNYSPHINMDKALDRREYVLSAMVENGYISLEEAEAAGRNTPDIVDAAENTKKNAWYIDEVLREAEKVLSVSSEEIISGGYSIYSELDTDMQLAAENAVANDSFFPETAAQGALIAMDTASGGIRALVGGRKYEVMRGLNRATQTRRQPGSAIKPVSTYAAAVDRFGYLPSTMVHDVWREYEDGYAPGNSGGNYYGEVTLRTALAKSLNAATVDLADTMGAALVCDYAKRFGLTIDSGDENLALSLGAMTYGVTPEELCSAYCALANGGYAVSGHTISSIVDKLGNVVYKHQSAAKRVVQPASAYIITDMLKTAASSGTAKVLSDLGFPVAAKTGTSGLANGDTSDAWSVAYTPEIAVAAWMGLDTNANGGMAAGVAGGNSAMYLCKSFITQICQKLHQNDFAVPDGLNIRLIDRYSLEKFGVVALISPTTPAEYTACEIFREGDSVAEASYIWELPQGVTGLEVKAGDKGQPKISLISAGEHIDYLVLRKTDADSNVIGIAKGDNGATIEFIDETVTNKTARYSVIPRNRLLYELGKFATGPESAEVQISGGIINDISQLLFGNDDNNDAESSEDSLFR